MLLYLLIVVALVCATIWAWMERRWLWLLASAFFAFNAISAGIVRNPDAALICTVLAAAVAVVVVPWQVENSRRRRVLQLRASGDYARLRELSPAAFEHHVADYMRAAGYERVEVVGGTSDGGVDIRAHDGTRAVLVQCKRYTGKKNKVGVKDVREFLGCLTDNGHPRGIFATTAAYTAPAEALAASHGIELWDGHEIAHRLAHLRTKDPVPFGVHLQGVLSRGRAKFGRSGGGVSSPQPEPSGSPVPAPVVEPVASSPVEHDPHLVEQRPRRTWRDRRAANRSVLDLLSDRNGVDPRQM
jgi:HJR/Mrr/RecB family endonuclease